MSAALELKKEAVLRKKAMNELRALKGNIRVCARIRPAQAGGLAGPDAALGVEGLDEYTLQVDTKRNQTEQVRRPRPRADGRTAALRRRHPARLGE